MAKKIVRGITDVKTINNQDYDTNNVNDLLSDGQHSYIHRKKGKSEEYHNLTDNIKTISSDNTDLLTVTNNNKTNNTATLHPKHDAQKEQVLESTRNTISINHGTNGTDEKTTVDTNPEKVLEHENLISDSEYITLNHQAGGTTTHIQTAALKQELNNLHETKQDFLTPGEGIIIEENIISATGVGDTYTTLEYYPLQTDWHYKAYRQVVTNGYMTLVTFTFICDPTYTEREVTLDIKNDLKKFVRSGMTVSNGGVTLTNDGTSIKLIKAATPENIYQHGTFTFLDDIFPS